MKRHGLRFLKTSLICGAAVLTLPMFVEGSELQAQTKPSPPVRAVITRQQMRNVLVQQSQMVLRALAKRDVNTLARFVHPRQGVRFSPYISVTGSDRVLSQKAVRQMLKDTQIHEWGSYDGTGEPIFLTSRQYLDRFVYNTNFLSSPPSINEFVQRGNTPNNLASAYPESIYVEFYRPGTQRYGGMDWNSLWLIWRPAGNNWALVGIAHDQWTI